MASIERISSRCMNKPTSLWLHLTIFATCLTFFSSQWISLASTLTSGTILVLSDKPSVVKGTHSSFFTTLEERGYKLIHKSSDDTTLKLTQYGEFLYDNIVIMGSGVDRFGGNVDLKELLNFIDEGRNVLLAEGNNPGTVVQELAREIGFDFKKSAAKREYTNTKLRDIYHIIGDRSSYPSTPSFAYSGTQLRMANSELTLDILSSNAPVDDTSNALSKRKVTSNVLIGTTQARNNARVVISGSKEFFSDKAYNQSSNQNKLLADQLTSWVFKDKGVLRFNAVTHNKINADDKTNVMQQQSNDQGYTIMDDIIYTVQIEIYENGKWSPYKADDVQLEFVRIDPFVRKTMEIVDDKYVAKFKVPDVYGVYKFQVDYKKEGLTYLFSSTQVSVRPLKHTEYERYIFSAYPYYLSAFLMMFYLYLFSFVFLYTSEGDQPSKSKTE